MSSSEEESSSGSDNSGSEQSSSEQSSGSGSSSGSDNSDSNSSNSDNSRSGSGSDSNSSNSDDSSNDSSNSDSNTDSSNDSDSSNKPKKVKKSKDPFINAMSTLSDVLGELDSIASSVDMISMRSGTSKPINWHPPVPKYDGPPKNYYAPGLCAGETPKRKNRSKKRIVRVVEEEESTERDDDSETVESDIAPTLSHNGTDNVLPYCEPRVADERYNMPPR